jgi:hypothetical protein
VPLRPGASARAVGPGYAPARCWRPLLATSSRYRQAPEARAMRPPQAGAPRILAATGMRHRRRL